VTLSNYRSQRKCAVISASFARALIPPPIGPYRNTADDVHGLASNADIESLHIEGGAMHAATLSSLRRHILIAGALLVSGLSAAPASAQDILLTGGSLDASGSVGNGLLILQGDRGFTFRGSTDIGNFQPKVCPCLAGDRISIFGSWSGIDVVGVATFDGITYPRVGDNGDTSSTSASLTVVFQGSVQLPHWGDPSSVVAPIMVNATFYYQGGPATFSGSGVATVELAQVTGYPQEIWAVKRVLYEIGDRLPSPITSHDIGAVGLQGQASQLRNTIAVLGDGGDIWGIADAFRFAYRDITKPGLVSAQVITQQNTYPAGWHEAAALNQYAKSGVMIRESVDAGAPSVILDVKPNGELEFMARYAAGWPTIYLGGATTPGQHVWLTLTSDAGGAITASYSLDGTAWTVIGTVTLTTLSSTVLAGLAVTSHDSNVLNGGLFDNVVVAGAEGRTNLLERGDFEAYDPPLLGSPGWISDDLLRQVPAKSETHQPRSGAKNGACWTPAYLDCGIYQEVVAPVTGAYTFQNYASADRAGGLVGANVNGGTAASADVLARPFGVYERYVMTFGAKAGDVIRVWMYSPAIPGYVVIDDVSLTTATAAVRQVTAGTWTISLGPSFAFDLTGADLALSGTYDAGEVGPLSACGLSGRTCTAGQQVTLSAGFVNQTPVTFESFARGSGQVNGVAYDFVEFGGMMRLNGGTVTLPSPPGGETGLVTVSAPFVASGDLRGFEVLGLREPRLVFDVPIVGAGVATLELLASPSGVYTFYRLVYTFEQPE
jgi:hypothetical protein